MICQAGKVGQRVDLLITASKAAVSGSSDQLDMVRLKGDCVLSPVWSGLCLFMKNVILGS